MGERDLVPGEDLGHAGVDAAVEHELVGGARLLEMAKCEPCTRFCRIQT
jgi:hypothetical protein